MIITKTPLRMSFFGGGTDLEDYFQHHKGAVLSTTMDKYCYVIVRRLPAFFDYTTELSYSKIERVTDVADIEHPAIRHAMQWMEVDRIRLSYEADLPARTGLGSSSAFAVGMLSAFHVLKGQYATKRQLADEAIYLERVLCQEAGGWQDQIAVSFGGFNRIDFDETGYTVTPLIVSRARKQALNDRLMLFYTGKRRYSCEIHQIPSDHPAQKEALQARMYELVDEAQAILQDPERDLDDFGHLLHTTWTLKRQTSPHVSTPGIDALYERGMNAGALGGKLLGAGNGGFFLFYVPVDRQPQVREALSSYLYIPFRFEEQGTRPLYCTSEPEEAGESRHPLHSSMGYRSSTEMFV